jgi:hypothetical protein
MATDMQTRDGDTSAAPFDLTRFFEGHTRAHGVFEDRKGRVRRRFTAEITGCWTTGVFILQEVFQYDDGMTERRVWQVRPEDRGTFIASCDDIAAPVTGHATHDGCRMAYTFLLSLASGKKIAVQVDDRMHQVHEDLLLNRATMRKWGIKIGELFITYERALKPHQTAPAKWELAQAAE